MGRRGKQPKERVGLRGGLGCSLELKLRAIREIQRGAGIADLARYFGIGEKTLYNWLRTNRLQGVQRLTPLTQAPVPNPRAVDPRRDSVVAMHLEHPEYGTRRISNMLHRFEALGVSATTVRRILHEEGFLPEKPAKLPKAARPPTSFERAEPNQLLVNGIFRKEKTRSVGWRIG